jgi:hypothetical protein
MAAAHGGQIVISGATESLVRDELPEGMELTDLGDHRLRDLGRPVRVFQLSPVDHRKSFPPLRSLDSFPGNLPAQASSAAPAVSAPASPEANFVLAALRETGDIVAAALGEERRSELRTRGAAMTMDEAISYALAHIDPKVLSGPMGR